jgi:hypothetical protein
LIWLVNFCEVILSMNLHCAPRSAQPVKSVMIRVELKHLNLPPKVWHVGRDWLLGPFLWLPGSPLRHGRGKMAQKPLGGLCLVPQVASFGLFWGWWFVAHAYAQIAMTVQVCRVCCVQPMFVDCGHIFSLVVTVNNHTTITHTTLLSHTHRVQMKWNTQRLAVHHTHILVVYQLITTEP